jgi:hypothetical protein
MIPYTISKIHMENNHHGSKDDILDLYWGSLAEIPSFFITIILAENAYLGRRRSLLGALAGAGLSMTFLLLTGY